jgi:hypothetical protein
LDQPTIKEFSANRYCKEFLEPFLFQKKCRALCQGVLAPPPFVTKAPKLVSGRSLDGKTQHYVDAMHMDVQNPGQISHDFANCKISPEGLG